MPAGLEALNALRGLSHLNLSTSASIVEIGWLTSLTGVRDLRIANTITPTPGFDDPGLPSCLHGFPQLLSLNISGCECVLCHPGIRTCL